MESLLALGISEAGDLSQVIHLKKAKCRVHEEKTDVKTSSILCQHHFMGISCEFMEKCVCEKVMALEKDFTGRTGTDGEL